MQKAVQYMLIIYINNVQHNHLHVPSAVMQNVSLKEICYDKEVPCMRAVGVY